MSRRRPRLAVACIVMASLVASGRVSAEDAEELYRRAIGRLAAAEFEASLALLERARELAREPALLARINLQLGVNHEVLGKVAAARAAFKAALENDPELEADPRRLRATALKLFDDVRGGLRGELEVSCRSGAAGEVVLDGQTAGAVPFRAPLPIGRHRLEVRRAAAGGASWTGSVLLAPGQRRQVLIACPPPEGTLSVSSTPAGAMLILDGKRLGATPLRRARVVAGSHVLVLRLTDRKEHRVTIAVAADRELPVEVVLAPIRPAPAPLPPRAPPRRLTIGALILGGAAVVGATAALGTGLAARADHAEWERLGQEGTDHQRWDEARRSGQQKELATNVLIGVSAGLATAATVLLVLDRVRGRAERVRLRGRIWPSPSGMVVEGEF